MTIGFVTSREIGAITADDALAAAALEKAGIRVRTVVWEDDDLPEECKALVLRSPWNYHLAPEAFLAWVGRAGDATTLFNDPQTVRWNAHKSYLLDLQRKNIPIVDTVFCERHTTYDLRAIMKERDWNRVVVKPAISASSFMTGIVGSVPGADQAGALEGRIVADGPHFLASILATRDALIQPFMSEILEHGERSLIFIDGQFSHAVQKAPFTDICGIGQPASADPGEIEVANQAISLLPTTPLYARVDLLQGRDGGVRVMELELVDPELYFRFDPQSPPRFASALLRRL